MCLSYEDQSAFTALESEVSQREEGLSESDLTHEGKCDSL